ncbi:hypothetical protein M440DRAFT_1455110, partial [Trichoderma longibrachiatum ATCC 18648]
EAQPNSASTDLADDARLGSNCLDADWLTDRGVAIGQSAPRHFQACGHSLEYGPLPSDYRRGTGLMSQIVRFPWLIDQSMDSHLICLLLQSCFAVLGLVEYWWRVRSENRRSW